MGLRNLLGGLTKLASGLLTGVGLGYLIGWLIVHFKDARSPEDLQARAQALADKPREVKGQIQARIQLAVEEGRQAAAETRAELEAQAPRRAESPKPST